MFTNCKNCGAPLHGWRCEYCGTQDDSFDIIDQPLIMTRDGRKIETLTGEITAIPDANILLPQNERHLRRYLIEQWLDRISYYISITKTKDPFTKNIKVHGTLELIAPKKSFLEDVQTIPPISNIRGR